MKFLRLREDFVGLHGDSAETSCRLHDDLMGLHGDSVGLHGDSMVTAGTPWEPHGDLVGCQKRDFPLDLQAQTPHGVPMASHGVPMGRHGNPGDRFIFSLSSGLWTDVCTCFENA